MPTSTPSTPAAIRIVGARENNLRNVSVDVPKRRVTVFTGVSGSGKSSLVFDTIAAESQRQLNDTFSTFIRHRLPHHAQPDADSLENLSAAIVVDQRRLGGNARSTVGTATDIQALVRLLFSRVGEPFVGYSNVFSFNHPDGMCPQCQGLGQVTTIDIERLFDRTLSLNAGAIRFSAFAVGGYRWKRYVTSGLFDNDKPLEQYTPQEWQMLLHADDVVVTRPLPGWPPSARYEGVLPRIRRSFLGKPPDEIKGLDRSEWERLVTRGPCPACKGARLNSKILSCRIAGRHIADWSALEIDALIDVVRAVHAPLAATLVPALATRLQHVVDIGLGYLNLGRETASLSGGRGGGQVVYQGDLAGLRLADTPTGRCLSRPPRLKTGVRRPAGWLPLSHVALNNLRDVSVKIPTGVMSVITGVAGSGKSSLINGAFVRAYPDTVCIDQRAAGMSRRANPATYTGMLDIIREAFAAANSTSASLFSANAGEACPACKGLGIIETDLAFMEPIVSVCERCRGARYTDEVLQYTLDGKNIAEVLAMTVEEARGFFNDPTIAAALQRLDEVGLAYVSLGQPLSSLSGGELQRLKLATELENTGRVYVFDEPTSGLHLSDIDRLVGLLDRLVDQGATAIVIEHQLDVIAHADWLIDMGPEAGRRGGKVMFEGTPAQMLSRGAGPTHEHLRRHVGARL